MFGLKHEDLDMAELIWSHGITVDDFIKMKEQEILPPPLKKAWDEYQKWLNEEVLRLGDGV